MRGTECKEWKLKLIERKTMKTKQQNIGGNHVHTTRKIQEGKKSKISARCH